MKILLDGYNSRFEMAEERTTELKSRSTEIRQSKEGKKEKEKKEFQRPVGHYHEVQHVIRVSKQVK